MFVGREKELQKLNVMCQGNHFEPAVLYGRKRVGKAGPETGVKHCIGSVTTWSSFGIALSDRISAQFLRGLGISFMKRM